MNIFQAYKINKEIKNSKNTPNREYGFYGKTVIDLQTNRYCITAYKVLVPYQVLSDEFGRLHTDTYPKYTFSAHNQKTYAHIASRGMFARIFFKKLNGKIKQ